MTQPEAATPGDDPEGTRRTLRSILRGVGLTTPLLAFVVMEVALTIQASVRSELMTMLEKGAPIEVAFGALIALPGALVTALAVVLVALASLRHAPLSLLSPLLTLGLALAGVVLTDITLDIGLHHVLQAYSEHAYFLTRDMWSMDLGWWWLIAWIVVVPLTVLTVLTDTILLPFLPFIVEEVGAPALLATLNGVAILLAASWASISINAAYAWSQGARHVGLDLVLPVALAALLAIVVTFGALVRSGVIDFTYPESRKPAPSASPPLVPSAPSPEPEATPAPEPEAAPEPPQAPAAPQPVEIAQVSASSSFKGGKHPPGDAFDGDPQTAWHEGAPGHGAGQWIEATLKGRWLLDRIEVTTGYDAASAAHGDLFDLNAHARQIRLEIDGRAVETRQVDKNQRRLIFEDLDVEADRVRLVVTKVYPGRRWKDLCLSEIAIVGVSAKSP